ncbi:MAG: DUF4153 domain-containing protein, partial [Thermoleophilaceae bacterium]
MRHLWPIPVAGAGAAAAAAATAAALPGTRVGVGAVAVAGLIGLAARATAPAGRSRVFGALAAGLALSPALRDAAWVVVTDLVAALWLAALAMLPAAGWRQLISALPAVARRLVPAWPAIIAALWRPARGRSARRALPLARGAILGAGLVVVFGALFVSADAAFAEVTRTLVPRLSVSLVPGRVCAFAAAGAVAGGLALLAAAPRPVEPAATEMDRPIAPVEWTFAIAALDVLFAAFVVVQITVLFGGHEHVLETTG